MAGKRPKFPPPIFETAPIVFSSTHGVYWPESTPEPFVVPKKTYIFETQFIGDLCLTDLDPPLWNLIQGDQRPLMNYLLSGKFDPAGLDEDEKLMANAFKYLNYYEPGDTIYNRYLSIGGGRTASGGSARSVYANMGFYLFPVGAPGDRYPDGPRSKILNRLRDDMITGVLDARGKKAEDIQLTYQEFINTVYKARPELKETGCIFVFSCCAEARYQDISKAEFDIKINEIELAQQHAHQKFLSLTPVARGGPLDIKIGAAEAAAPASGASGGAKEPTYALPKGAIMSARREGLRGAKPREFHPSAFEKDKLEYRQLANTGWADREVKPHPNAPVQPAGTHAIFRVKKNGSMKQIIDTRTGQLFYRPREIRQYMSENPTHTLKVYTPSGEFANIESVLAGGKRTRRRFRRSRMTRKKHL